MRYKGVLALAGAGVAVTAFLATPVGAQEDPPHGALALEVSPTSGPAGSVITVSGAGCVLGAVEAGLIDPEVGTGVAFDDTHGDQLGNWVVELQVPEDAVPDTTYTVHGECIAEGGPDYEDSEFVVTDAPVPALLPTEVDPTSGPVGTNIHVSGSDCPSGQMYVWLFKGAGVDPATGVIDAEAIVDEQYVEAPPDGSWSGDLVVHDTMYLFPLLTVEADVVPGRGFVVQAVCFLRHDLGGGVTRIQAVYSEAFDFEITPGGTPPKQTDPPPVGPSAPDIQAQAPPATPVPGDPDFTG